MTRRGQLLLLGAIALAVIVIGLTVALELSIFTQTTTAAGVSESATETDTAIAALGPQVRTAVQSVTESPRRADPDDLPPLEVAANTTLGSTQASLSREHLARTGGWITVESVTPTAYGTRISQLTPAPLTDATGADTWRIYNDTTADSTVGAFMLRVDNGTTTLEVANDSTTATVELTRDDDSATVSWTRGGESIQTCTLSVPAGTPLRVDVAAGTAGPGDCQGPARGGIVDPTTITIVGGDTATGTYALVSDQDRGAVTDERFVDDSAVTDQPYAAVAVWEVAVTYEHTAPPATATGTTRVVIYR